MILVKSNGLVLTCRQVGPVLYQLEPTTKRFPLPIVLNQIMEESQARELVKELLKSGDYTSVNL